MHFGKRTSSSRLVLVRPGAAIALPRTTLSFLPEEVVGMLTACASSIFSPKRPATRVRKCGVVGASPLLRSRAMVGN